MNKQHCRPTKDFVLSNVLYSHHNIQCSVVAVCVCGVDILMSERGPAQNNSILDVFFKWERGC